MRVRCVKDFPSASDIEILGKSFDPKQDFHVTPGKEYTVYGLAFLVNSCVFGNGPVVEIVSDYGQLGWSPLCLYEMIDPRASKYWIGRYYTDDGSFLLRPPSFFVDYFNDDLADRKKEAVAEFKRIKALIDSEQLPSNDSSN